MKSGYSHTIFPLFMVVKAMPFSFFPRSGEFKDFDLFKNSSYIYSKFGSIIAISAKNPSLNLAFIFKFKILAGLKRS